MGLPAPSTAACLLRNTWSDSSPAGAPRKGSEMCPHGTGRKESGILTMNMISQGPLGPALSKTHVDCVEGPPALLLDSLSSTVPTSLQFSPQDSQLRGTRTLPPTNRMCGPNANAPQTVVKAHIIEWQRPAGHCWRLPNPSLTQSWARPALWAKSGSTLVSTTTPERVYIANVVTCRCPALSLAPSVSYVISS